MSGSVTVIGSHTGSTLTGILTVPVDLTAGTLGGLQTALSTLSTAITSFPADTLYNNSVPGAAVSTTGGVFEITTGSLNASVPVGYNALITSSGSESVQGNGSLNFLALFGKNSSVGFNSEGGSGTVVAGGSGDFALVSGNTWSVLGSSDGGDTVNSNASSAYITTYGQGSATGNAIGADSVPSNVVGLAGAAATVNSFGTNDLIETYAGKAVVTVNGSANVLVNGGADTVYAAIGNTGVRAFFNLFGGTLDFINNSDSAATVSGAVPGASGGSTTAFGGTGGGVYIGGQAGNNSLIGGTGSVTLVAAGTNNILSVTGSFGSYATQNVLEAGDGGATLVASSTTDYNQFYGGSGTDSIVSFGSGKQTYYVGSTGSEQFTGSTVSGANNEYIFNQSSSGNGADVITDFRVGQDHIDINANGSLSGVTIDAVKQLDAGTTIIQLSNKTTIQLYGVSASSISSSVIGGTHI